jgi:hypothetical protein
MSHSRTFASLPEELRFMIMEFLSLEDIISSRLVSRDVKWNADSFLQRRRQLMVHGEYGYYVRYDCKHVRHDFKCNEQLTVVGLCLEYWMLQKLSFLMPNLEILALNTLWIHTTCHEKISEIFTSLVCIATPLMIQKNLSTHIIFVMSEDTIVWRTSPSKHIRI